ncbi:MULTISPECIES: UPF0262 family protein [Acetobacter]|uniref:UPF0262 family protein n=1 Tax=Acetobacter sacchari TaxID=2661687 RepID=A0ABS3LYG6_9PROT|nr:UPF0262 family protein [Acetobacter sp. DsW_063]MBO1360965.1 UPF0262 family protein [Acetobacter sacchari]OUJ16738.1 hypothetical protein HK28_09310 [Acetobacter sp. DsW_063]
MTKLFHDRNRSNEPTLPPDRPDALIGVVLASALDTAADANPARQRDREQAIVDLCQTAHFRPVGLTGPFILHLSVSGHQGLVFDVRSEEDQPLHAQLISLTPFGRLLKDYALMIDSFEAAMEEGNRSKVQAIDMGRRGIHDEAADLLMERLDGKIAMDRPTARRLFTLICLLTQRG